MIDLYITRSTPVAFLLSKLHVTCILLLRFVLHFNKRKMPKIIDHQYNMFSSFQPTCFIGICCSLSSSLNFSRILPDKQDWFHLSVLVLTLQVITLYFSASKLSVKLLSLKFAIGRSFPKANLEHWSSRTTACESQSYSSDSARIRPSM